MTAAKVEGDSTLDLAMYHDKPPLGPLAISVFARSLLYRLSNLHDRRQPRGREHARATPAAH